MGVDIESQKGEEEDQVNGDTVLFPTQMILGLCE